MAAVDKIYGTYEQEQEFRKWAEENNPAVLPFFYPWEGEWLTDGKTHPITNFPAWADRVVLDTCPLDWVTARILEQYGGKRP